MTAKSSNLVRRKEIGRAKRMRTRSAMLEAAKRLIAAKGCDAPTIHDFIREAAVAHGTFYNYFKDRVQVIEAVAQEVLASLKAEIASTIRGVADPAERIARIVQYCIHKAHDDVTWGAMMVHMTPAGPYLGNAMHQEFAADLDAGLKSGRFRFASIAAALDVVKGSTLFGMRSMARGHDEPELAQGIATLVLRGLGVRASEAMAISRRCAATPSAAKRARLRAKGHRSGLEPTPQRHA